MKTQIEKKGDMVIISFNGKLSFETHLPMRDDLLKLASITNRENQPLKKVIFNLEKLDFVGSSGISSFIQVLKEFNAYFPMKPKYCNVKSEFQKIIQALDTEKIFEFYEDEKRAQNSFN